MRVTTDERSLDLVRLVYGVILEPNQKSPRNRIVRRYERLGIRRFRHKLHRAVRNLHEHRLDLVQHRQQLPDDSGRESGRSNERVGGAS